MSHRGFRVTAVTSAAALTALTLVAGTPALAGQVHAGRATSPAGDAGAAGGAGAAGVAGGARQVMLPTGDVVSLSTLPGGRQTASVIRAHKQGPGGQFQMFNEGKDLYVVPQSAVPYLGSTLSLSMFDVTQLASQEHGSLALTVQLRLRSTASRAAAVPGITITHRSGLTATGRLTEASARAFGAALAAQAERDHASATHTTGLFADVANITTAATGAAQASTVQASAVQASAVQASAVQASTARTTTAHTSTAAKAHTRPAFQMYTLTVNGINAAGKKDTGDLALVYNVDNLQKYSGNANFVNGSTKISVPAGHYAAVCFFYNYTTGAAAEVTLPQFSVTSDSSSITLDARTATSPVTVSTPRPADPQVNEVAVARADSIGQVGSYSFLGTGQTTFSVNPVTSGIGIGQLYYYVYSRLFSPAGAKAAYTYDVEFPSDGAIPVDEHFVAQASNLATVGSSYPADKAGTTALDTRFGALPWQSFLFGSDLNLTTPLQRTEYYTAAPDLSWEGVYYSVFRPSPFALLGEFDGAWTVYQPGTSSSTTWGGEPEHPRLLETPIFINQVYCPACINGDTLNLLAFPFSDNSPDHRSYTDGKTPGLKESAAYDVYADGVEVRKGTGFLEKKVTLPTGVEDLRIDYDTTRSSANLTLATSAATTWTVKTSAPTGALPADWFCDFDNHTKCGVLPLMFADYSLPVNLLGQLAPGSVTTGIDVSHLAGATDVAITSLNVGVSFNGGTSWQKASVTAEGLGQYAVSFTVPATAKTDGFGAIRLGATDAYGGTLSQTIQHAFAVAAS